MLMPLHRMVIMPSALTQLRLYTYMLFLLFFACILVTDMDNNKKIHSRSWELSYLSLIHFI